MSIKDMVAGLVIGVASVALMWVESAQAAGVYDITISKRRLYGPGPFADQELGLGKVSSMHFDTFMNAIVPAFNNGPE